MSLVLVQWVKDLALPQLWCRWQLWLRFDPWPRNFHMPQVQGGKKKEKGIGLQRHNEPSQLGLSKPQISFGLSTMHCFV